MSPYQSEQFDKLLKYLMEAGERNITEKRKNFEHLTLLIGTVLGFSVGLTAATGGEPSCLLVFSWILQVIALLVGSFYLVFETESRYSRIIASAGKQAELININTTEELKEKAKSLFTEAQKIFLDISSGKTLREKSFIAFTKCQRQIEILFYISFIFSFALLVFSFLQS